MSDMKNLLTIINKSRDVKVVKKNEKYCNSNKPVLNCSFMVYFNKRLFIEMMLLNYSIKNRNLNFAYEFYNFS